MKQMFHALFPETKSCSEEAFLTFKISHAMDCEDHVWIVNLELSGYYALEFILEAVPVLLL